MSHDNNFSTYAVSWQVCVTLPAHMKVKAPAGLCDEDLIAFIRDNYEFDADFEIDNDDFEYDSGFEDLELYFHAEVCDQD